MIIAVCDDQITEGRALAGCLASILSDRKLSGRPLCFSSSDEMLEAMGNGTFPINFLDIYMDGMNGVELARMIRERNPRAAIVFTTSSRDHMADGFDVGAVHYLTKPFGRADVEVALDRCLMLSNSAEPYLELRIQREIKKVMYSQILYIESQNRCCIVHTLGDEIRSYIRLDQLQEQLKDPRFLRCHRSYIVNLDCIQSIRGNDFLLISGIPIPLRREKRAEFKAAFENYYFEKTRSQL